MPPFALHTFSQQSDQQNVTNSWEIDVRRRRKRSNSIFMSSYISIWHFFSRALAIFKRLSRNYFVVSLLSIWKGHWAVHNPYFNPSPTVFYFELTRTRCVRVPPRDSYVARWTWTPLPKPEMKTLWFHRRHLHGREREFIDLMAHHHFFSKPTKNQWSKKSFFSSMISNRRNPQLSLIEQLIN